MAPHYNTLALKIPWTEELGAGYCPWGGKESARLSDFTFTFYKVHISWLCPLKSLEAVTTQ